MAKYNSAFGVSRLLTAGTFSFDLLACYVQRTYQSNANVQRAYLGFSLRQLTPHDVVFRPVVTFNYNLSHSQQLRRFFSVYWCMHLVTVTSDFLPINEWVKRAELQRLASSLAREYS